MNVNEIIKKLGLPCFVKANRSGSSYGVFKVHDEKELIPSINEAFKEDHQLIIESALNGREFSVGVAKYENEIHILPITEIITENDFFDYSAKYEGQSKRSHQQKFQKIGKENYPIYQKLFSKSLVSQDSLEVNLLW